MNLVRFIEASKYFFEKTNSGSEKIFENDHINHVDNIESLKFPKDKKLMLLI